MNFFEVVVFSEFFEKEKGAGWVTWAGPRRNGSPRAGAQWRRPKGGRRAQDRAFLFLVFFSFFTKKYSNFFYKSSSLAGAPWGLVPWSMAPGCQAPPPRALGTLAPRPGEPGPRCKKIGKKLHLGPEV